MSLRLPIRCASLSPLTAYPSAQHPSRTMICKKASCAPALHTTVQSRPDGTDPTVPATLPAGLPPADTERHRYRATPKGSQACRSSLLAEELVSSLRIMTIRIAGAERKPAHQFFLSQLTDLEEELHLVWQNHENARRALRRRVPHEPHTSLQGRFPNRPSLLHGPRSGSSPARWPSVTWSHLRCA
jgi:hypothetical protein